MEDNVIPNTFNPKNPTERPAASESTEGNQRPAASESTEGNPGNGEGSEQEQRGGEGSKTKAGSMLTPGNVPGGGNVLGPSISQRAHETAVSQRDVLKMESHMSGVGGASDTAARQKLSTSSNPAHKLSNAGGASPLAQQILTTLQASSNQPEADHHHTRGATSSCSSRAKSMNNRNKPGSLPGFVGDTNVNQQGTNYAGGRTSTGSPTDGASQFNAGGVLSTGGTAHHKQRPIHSRLEKNLERNLEKIESEGFTIGQELPEDSLPVSATYTNISHSNTTSRKELTTSHEGFASHMVWWSFALILGFGIGVVNIGFHKFFYIVDDWWLAYIVDASGNNKSKDLDLKADMIYHVLRATGVIISGVIVGFSTAYIVPECSGGGNISVRACIALGSFVPFHVGAARFVLTIVYLAFGNPLGAEAPTLHICAAVSCTLYMLCQKLDRAADTSFFPMENRTTMIIVGCTCGLAAAFAAPIGSILYAIEEFRQGHGGEEDSAFTALITTASVIAVVTSSIAIKGSFYETCASEEYNLSPTKTFVLLFFALPLGVASAYSGKLFTDLVLRTRAKFKAHLQSIQQMIFAAIGTTLLATLCYEFTKRLLIWYEQCPDTVYAREMRKFELSGVKDECLGEAEADTPCGWDGVWGPGGRTMLEILKPRAYVIADHSLMWPYLLCSLVFLVCKFLACAGAVASGGSGGVFAPALVLGAAQGAVYGGLVGYITDDPHYQLLFVPVGMAGQFASMIRLPITAVVIVREMTSVGGSATLFTMLFCSIVSFAVNSDVQRSTLWDQLMEQDNINLESLQQYLVAALDQPMAGGPGGGSGGGRFDRANRTTMCTTMGGSSDNHKSISQSTMQIGGGSGLRTSHAQIVRGGVSQSYAQKDAGKGLLGQGPAGGVPNDLRRTTMGQVPDEIEEEELINHYSSDLSTQRNDLTGNADVIRVNSNDRNAGYSGGYEGRASFNEQPSQPSLQPSPSCISHARRDDSIYSNASNSGGGNVGNNLGVENGNLELFRRALERVVGPAIGTGVDGIGGGQMSVGKSSTTGAGWGRAGAGLGIPTGLGMPTHIAGLNNSQNNKSRTQFNVKNQDDEDGEDAFDSGAGPLFSPAAPVKKPMRQSIFSVVSPWAWGKNNDKTQDNLSGLNRAPMRESMQSVSMQSGEDSKDSNNEGETGGSNKPIRDLSVTSSTTSSGPRDTLVPVVPLTREELIMDSGRAGPLVKGLKENGGGTTANALGTTLSPAPSGFFSGSGFGKKKHSVTSLIFGGGMDHDNQGGYGSRRPSLIQSTLSRLGSLNRTNCNVNVDAILERAGILNLDTQGRPSGNNNSGHNDDPRPSHSFNRPSIGSARLSFGQHLGSLLEAQAQEEKIRKNTSSTRHAGRNSMREDDVSTNPGGRNSSGVQFTAAGVAGLAAANNQNDRAEAGTGEFQDE